MERYTKQGKQYTGFVIHTFFMFFMSLYFLYSFIYNLINAESTMEYLLTFMVLCFAMSIWGSLYISIRSLKTKIFVDENGMGIKRFNRTIVYIRYEDIRETGTGKALGPMGETKKLYFSPVALTEDKEENLDKLQNEIIYFTEIDEEWMRYIEEHSGLKIDGLY